MESRKIRSSGLTLERLFSLVILLCIFLGSLNLVNRYYYCIYIAALFFVMTPKRKLWFNFDFLILLFFSMSILLFDPSSQTMVTNMIKPFTYPLCYLMGLSLFSFGGDRDIDIFQQEKRTSLVIFTVSAGVMLHFILNMITNWEIDNRHVIDFWTNDEASATGQATLACLMIAVSVSFLFSRVGKKKKIVALFSLLLILTYNLILAGRTIFVLILISIGVAVLYTGYANKQKYIKLILIVALSVVLLLLLYNTDTFGIKTAFESSNFYDRFYGDSYAQDIEDDSRMENKLYYIKHFFDSMLGGGHIREEFGHSAHDLYLDTYDEAGIFALIAIGTYILTSILRVFKCARNKRLSFEIRLLCICVCVVVNVQFWLEPILRGIPWLLAAYCLIDGAVTRLLVEEKSMYNVS